MAERVTIFFYGLFMDPEALQAKGLRPSRTRQAYVERFALKLGARATLVPIRDGRVYGTIMRLTHAEIDQLYSEPSVAAYRPEPVLAQLADGTAELALCFNLPTAPRSPSDNPEYAAALQAVARKVGLPAEYVAELSRC
ncbi:gamma-glutamylcyclotransferase [Bradyrhizobium sp. CB1650]|uniref:gamma-glutamylcyclotransferase family protein n=1 Tax=Bradyrhizobium sp. CB1650 TaxID=3039153 RepID=UPI0024357FD0|nr:gamma-glutamylcyclotransferase [Bradyrhizobium sp. CB1650]WGD55147.1 gamma-glutamylcyclotransferase [Bradyrhizobium sp. CB1650]